MGHYWSEMRGEPTQEELDQERAYRLANKLSVLPSSHFTVAELMLLMRTNWSRFKENYYKDERELIFSIASREGISDGVE